MQVQVVRVSQVQQLVRLLLVVDVDWSGFLPDGLHILAVLVMPHQFNCIQLCLLQPLEMPCFELNKVGLLEHVEEQA